VLKLKEHFEQGALHARTYHTGNLSKFDLSKVRKKLSDSRNRRIKRRHTVGGTKDFTANILCELHQEKSRSSWDRLAPNNVSLQETRMSEELERSSEEMEERRRSLPNCGTDRPTESHV